MALKRESEERLQMAEKWRQVINSVDEWHILLDSELKVMDVNNAGLAAFYPKLNKKDVIGKAFSEFAADIIPRYKKFKDVIKTGTPYIEENIITSPRNSEEKYHINIKAVKIGEGVSITAKNITKRKLAEIALRESEEKYHMLFDNADPVTSITYFDTDLKIVLANQNAMREIGIDNLQNIKGMDMATFFHRLPKDQIAMLKKRYKKVIKEGRGVISEDLVEFNQGKQWYLNNTQPVKDAKDKVIGFVVFAYNITERKKMEDELKQKNIELEESNIALRVLLRKKDEERDRLEEYFLDNMETLILPYIEELKNSPVKQRWADLLDLIENNFKEVASSFTCKLSSKFYRLTPTEIRIASMIKQGRTTKEIADTIKASGKTVENHRASIRKKLGISNKNKNLATHLLSLK